MKISKADFRKYLAVFFGISAFIYMGLITFCTVPEANNDRANIILGFLITTALSTIIGFYFGASEQEDPGTLDAVTSDLKTVLESPITKGDIEPCLSSPSAEVIESEKK